MRQCVMLRKMRQQRTIRSNIFKVVFLLCIVVYAYLQITVVQTSGRSWQSKHQDSTIRQALTILDTTTKLSKDESGNTLLSTGSLEHLTVTVNISIESRCGDHVRLVLGHQRQYKGFLTIGICTVPRERASYVENTLRALFSESSYVERKDVVIVLFLGNNNETWRREIQEMVKQIFSDNLEKGEIQVVQPDESVYPNISAIRRRTFNDSLTRVHWRTKQNIDFAYMFGYCDGISDYYLHLEDDVIAASNYISELKQSLSFYKHIDNHWLYLNFGRGFYGKLFKSGDMCMMKYVLLHFKEEKPCDLLLHDLKHIKLQDSKKVKDGKVLFKHIGEYSSLKGKRVTERPLKSKRKSFEAYVSRLSRYQYASVETSMETYANFTPELAYEVNNMVYFWAHAPKTGDFYRVILNNIVNTTRVAIRTGKPGTGGDELENGIVYKNKELTADGLCRSQVPLGKITSATFEHMFPKAEELKCLEIVVGKQQRNWVVIAQIEIET